MSPQFTERSSWGSLHRRRRGTYTLMAAREVAPASTFVQAQRNVTIDALNAASGQIRQTRSRRRAGIGAYDSATQNSPAPQHKSTLPALAAFHSQRSFAKCLRIDAGEPFGVVLELLTAAVSCR